MNHQDASNIPASDTLERVASHGNGERVTLGELLQSMHQRGFGLLLMIFVLPNCVPIPIPPGGSTVFSVPLLFLTVQMLWAKDSPWLPKWLARKTLRRSTLQALVKGIVPRLRRLEKLLKPRMQYIRTKGGEQFLGFMMLLFAISIAIPLPMTNFLPGVGILVTSLGLLGRDGVVAILGLLVGCFGLLVTSGVLLLGAGAVKKIFPYLI